MIDTLIRRHISGLRIMILHRYCLQLLSIHVVVILGSNK